MKKIKRDLDQKYEKYIKLRQEAYPSEQLDLLMSKFGDLYERDLKARTRKRKDPFIDRDFALLSREGDKFIQELEEYTQDLDPYETEQHDYSKDTHFKCEAWARGENNPEEQKYLDNPCKDLLPPSLSSYPKDLSEYPYILGPKCVHLLTSKNLCVLLFGESHYERFDMKNTIPTQFYLDKLIQKSRDKVFDIYVEEKTEEYKSTRKIRDSLYKMDQFEDFFSRCIEGDYERCRNVRFHAIDIRDQRQDFPCPESIEDIDNYIEMLKTLDYEEENQLVLKEIKEITPYPEEFKRAKDALYKYYLQVFSKKGQMERRRDYIERLSFSKGTAFDTIPFDEEIAYGVIGELNLSEDILEVYALARMFHTYRTKPHQARNMMFYAGDKHTTKILDFLITEIGMDVVYTDCNNLLDYVKAPPVDKLLASLR